MNNKGTFVAGDRSAFCYYLSGLSNICCGREFASCRPSFLGARNRIRFAVRFRRGNIFTRIVCAVAYGRIRSGYLVLPRPIWSGVYCAIYCFVATSLWFIDREALPLELSASLLARGLTARFDSRHSLFSAQVCFRATLEPKLPSLAFSTGLLIIPYRCYPFPEVSPDPPCPGYGMGKRR